MKIISILILNFSILFIKSKKDFERTKKNLSLIRNPFFQKSTCPAFLNSNPTSNPKIVTFQQWKDIKNQNSTQQIHPNSNSNLKLKSNLNKSSISNNHSHLNYHHHKSIQNQINRNQISHHSIKSIKNVSHQNSDCFHSKSIQSNPIPHPTLFDFEIPISSDLIYQPDPNTGTGNPDDPLKILSTRTNYASVDCSASIHSSSKKSKSPSAILNEKKDKYMLTPCTNNRFIKPQTKNTSSSTYQSYPQSSNFVIFELCDEIEIDSVVLANFEFFSSMFKIIRMSASNSGVEGLNGAEWINVGYLKTHNIRGFQVFYLKHLKGFYRYVRLDFLTHYGSEYYCPLSLVRIYGLTQIDAYRRDTKLEERNKQNPIENQIPLKNDHQFSTHHTFDLPHISSADNLDVMNIFNEETQPIKLHTQDNSNQVHDSSDPIDSPLLHPDQQNSSHTSDPKHLNVTHSGKTSLPAENTHSVENHDLPESTIPTVLNTAEPSSPNPKIPKNPPVIQQLDQDQPSSHLTQGDSQNLAPSNSILEPSSPSELHPESDLPSARSHQPDDPMVTVGELENHITTIQDEPSSQLPQEIPTTMNHHDTVPTPHEPITSSLVSQLRGENGQKVPGSSDPKNSHISSSKIPQSHEKLPNMNLPIQPINSNPNLQGTESIFGQIMKRLNHLESNHHLLLNYLEEQVLVLESSGNRLSEKLAKFNPLFKIQIKKHKELKKSLKKIKEEIMTLDSLITMRIEALESTIMFIKRFGLIQFLSILSILIFLGLTRTSTSSNVPSGSTRASRFPNNLKRHKSRLSHGSRITTEKELVDTNSSRSVLVNGSKKTSFSTTSRSLIRSNYLPSSPNREYYVSSTCRNKSFPSRSPQRLRRTNSPPPILSGSSHRPKKTSSPPVLMGVPHSISKLHYAQKNDHENQQGGVVDQSANLTNTNQNDFTNLTPSVSENSLVEDEGASCEKNSEQIESPVSLNINPINFASNHQVTITA